MSLHPACPETTPTATPAPKLDAAESGRARAAPRSDSRRPECNGGGLRAKYKQRRARARERKRNEGRALRLTPAVPEAGAICVDMALEKVTTKRQPQIMSEEEVQRLLAMSKLMEVSAHQSAVAGPSKQLNAVDHARVVELEPQVKVQPKVRHKIQIISDSQANALLSRSSA